MNAETVIKEYQSSLRAFLLSRMRGSSDVDDVLQVALTKTFQKLHTLNSEEKIKTWLFQITRNAMMDHYRHKHRESSVLPDDLWYDDPDGMAEHAFEGCIEPFLDALPKETGDLLRAVEIQGVSQKKYAEN
jgi:RNA polymerase sigma-70 factor (ECF subfamily)